MRATYFTNMIRTAVVLTFLAFVAPVIIMAQQPGQISSMRAAFITSELDLTPAESTAFFPKYNEYREEYKKLVTQYKKLKDSGNLTIEQNLKYQQDMVTLKTKYFGQFGGILPQPKLDKLPEAEDAFKEKLINIVKNGNGK